MPNFTEIEGTFCGQTERTFETQFTRSTQKSRPKNRIRCTQPEMLKNYKLNFYVNKDSHNNAVGYCSYVYITSPAISSDKGKSKMKLHITQYSLPYHMPSIKSLTLKPSILPMILSSAGGSHDMVMLVALTSAIRTSRGGASGAINNTDAKTSPFFNHNKARIQKLINTFFTCNIIIWSQMTMTYQTYKATTSKRH